MDMAANENIFDHRAVLEQSEILERAADAMRCVARRAQSRDACPFKQDCAGTRFQHAADHVEQRRLACAIGANDAAYLAFANAEADVRHRFQATEAARNALQLENGRHDSHLLRRL